MIPFVSAWVGHTDASREYAEDFPLALADIGLSQKAAAIVMGLTDQQLSRQLRGTEPLSAYRVCLLPAAFHLAFFKRRCARLGADVLTPEQVQYLRGAASLGVRKMAKMLPDVGRNRRSA